MSNFLTLNDVKEAQAAQLRAMPEFAVLGEEVIAKSVAARLEDALSKGMVTSGIVPASGSTGADAAKVEDLAGAIGLQALGVQHATTWNMLPKKATVSDAVEYVTADSVGETVGGGYVDPSAADGGTTAIDGTLERKFLPVKWYASQFQTFVNAMSVTSVGFNGAGGPGEADSNNKFMALNRHVRNLNWACLHADNAVNAFEPTGLIQQVRAVHTSSRVTRLDMNGQPLAPETLAIIGQVIYGNSGSVTDLMFGPTPLADFQQQLFASQRSNFGQSIGMLSYPDATLVQGIGQDPNKCKLHRDLDLDYGVIGFDDHAADTNAPNAPTSVTGAATTGAANWRGNTGITVADTYYYSAVSHGAKGRSVAEATTGVVVAAGEKVTLTINNTDATIKEFRIYRGTSETNRQYIGRVKRDSAAVAFVDNGEKDPGTGTALALTIAPMGDGQSTIQARQLYPMAVIDLPRTLMAFNKAYLTGFTPQVRTPFQQLVIENIGRYSG